MVSQRRASQTILCLFFICYVSFFLFVRGPMTPTDGSLPESASDDTLTSDVLTSLGRLLSNIEADYTEFNVDGLFGLRLTQGQIFDAFTEASKGYIKIAPAIHKKAEEVVHQMNKLGDASYKHLMGTGSAYSQRFGPVLSGPLNVTGGFLRFKTAIPKITFDDNYQKKMLAYNESEGDTCMALLFGTEKDETNKLSFPKCTVTQDCVDYLLSAESIKMTAGYSLTHSVLYVYLARREGCEQNVQSHLSTSLASVLEDICSRVYAEANILMKENVLFLDIFMETIVMCGGLSGFEEFYRKDWWNLISDLQDESGCFKVMLPDNYKNEMNEDNHTPSFHSRKLLRDNIMRGNCSSHTTGVAAGAIGAYARYLMEHDGHFFIKGKLV